MKIALASRSTPERIEYDVQTDNDIDRVLWYETVLGTPPTVPDRLDAALIAMVPRAMHGGQDLHVEGPVSWSLLANVEEYIDVWTLWLPDLFRPIAITADHVVDDRGDGAGNLASRSLFAWSGGVDSTYALVSNTVDERGHRALPIAAAIQVHGFDIPIDDRAEFDGAVAAGSHLLAAYGIDHVAVRTNWHAEMCPDWEMTFFAGLASVLHHFTDRGATALVAPANTYDHVRLPWGSNPISNPLLASSQLSFLAPGRAQRRYQKCEVIGAVPEVREHLRVCWQAPRLGRNCGQCEKCIRTKVSFLAAGHGAIEALGPLTQEDLDSMRVTAPVTLDNYEFMVPAVAAHDPEAAKAVTEMVARERARLPLAD
ncbi:MAG: hypothetical protein ABI239_12435 [Aquihabitans sp.]